MFSPGFWCSHGSRRKLSRWSHDAWQQPGNELPSVYEPAGLPRAQQGLHAAGHVRAAQRGIPSRAWIWGQVRKSLRGKANIVHAVHECLCDCVAVFRLCFSWELCDVRQPADVTTVGDVCAVMSHPCADSQKHTHTRLRPLRSICIAINLLNH